MKQILQQFTLRASLLVMLLVGAIGSAWGDEVYKTALFGADYNPKNTTYTSSFDATNGSFIVTVTNFNNNNNGWTNSSGNGQIKCGRKTTASTGVIATKAPIDKAITKVVLTIDAITSKNVNSLSLYKSSNNTSWTYVGSFSKSTGTQTVAISTPEENLYYKIEFSCDDKASSNGLVTVSKIEYYYTPSGSTATCATPTFSPAAGTYTSAQNVTISTETSGATIYYTTDGTNPTTNSSTYSSAISVNQTTTIKAMAVKDGMTNSAIAEATYTIVNLEHTGTEADPYTVADARTAIDANTGITNVYAMGVVSEIVTAYNSKYGNISFDFVDSEGDSNTLRAYRCTGEEAANVQVGDIVVVSGDLTLYGSTYEFNSGCTLVSRTSSSTKVAADLAFSATTASADLANPSAFTAPTLTNPHSLAVTYSSSNTEVATVAADGTVTILAEGTTTITASSEETEQYLAGTASYILTVTSSNKHLVTIDADGNVTFDLSDNGWGFPDGSTNKTTKESSYTADGYTITLAGGGSGNGHYFNATDKYLMLGKSDATLTLPAFDFAVEKIEVVGRTGASGKVTQNIFVGQTAVSTETTGATGTNTYVIAEDNQAAGTIYTLKVTNANNTQIISIKVYKGTVDEREEVTLSFTSVPATIVVDETATYTATATPSVTGITYSSSDENVLMVDETTGEIAALAVGEATITASFAGNETYKPATASYTITVVAPQHTAKFFVNGEEQTEAEAQVAEGAAITFPEATPSIEGKTFVGWTTAAIDGETDEAPAVLVTTATMGTADVTYYAVYATQEGEGGSSTATLTSANIKASYVDPNGYANRTISDGEGNTWHAYAMSSKHSNATSDYYYLQIKKSDASQSYYIQVPQFGAKITGLIMTVSNSNKPMTDGGNTATLFFSASNTTSAAGEGVVSGTGDKSVTLDCSSLDLNTGYITAGGAVRIWDVTVTYGTPASYSGYCTTVTTPAITVTLNSQGYATFSSAQALDFTNAESNGYTAWQVTGVEGTSINFEQINGAVAAGTGVLLKGTAGDNITLTSATEGVDISSTNKLVAITVATSIEAYQYYGLSGNTFVKVKAGTVKAGKALLPASVVESIGSDVKALSFNFGGIVTSIDSMNADNNAEIYNLAGQRVEKMQKGIYVVGGKKMLVK